MNSLIRTPALGVDWRSYQPASVAHTAFALFRNLGGNVKLAIHFLSYR